METSKEYEEQLYFRKGERENGKGNKRRGKLGKTRVNCSQDTVNEDEEGDRGHLEGEVQESRPGERKKA